MLVEAHGNATALPERPPGQRMSPLGGQARPRSEHSTVVLSKKETFVFAAYDVVALLTSAVNGSASIASFAGRGYPKSQADKSRVP
ncbi:hypothetical protein [Streptomyces sp. NPDC091217]|uniref:hypothetical protein n=1 Tax=Streptomyces sp. NPDC091217 TaxID=3365975 RepID=UPI0038027BB7